MLPTMPWLATCSQMANPKYGMDKVMKSAPVFDHLTEFLVLITVVDNRNEKDDPIMWLKLPWDGAALWGPERASSIGMGPAWEGSTRRPQGDDLAELLDRQLQLAEPGSMRAESLKHVRKWGRDEYGCGKCGKSKEEGKKGGMCGKCESIWYCSRTCQVAHWGEHKSMCKVMGKLGEGTSSHA